MAKNPSVVIHFKDLVIEDQEQIKTSIEKRCEALAEEFREVSRFEITLTEAGSSIDVHGHATGKNTDVATHAAAGDPGPATDRVLDKIERQLRKVHDKRIFSQRRDAQKSPPKRQGS